MPMFYWMHRSLCNSVTDFVIRKRISYHVVKIAVSYLLDCPWYSCIPSNSSSWSNDWPGWTGAFLTQRWPIVGLIWNLSGSSSLSSCRCCIRLWMISCDYEKKWWKTKYFIWGSRNFQLMILQVILLTPLLGLSADSVRMNSTVTNKMILSNWINILQLVHGEMCFIFSPSSFFSSALIACSNIHKCNHLFFKKKEFQRYNWTSCLSPKDLRSSFM